MGIDIKLPPKTATLEQLNSYLFQLAQQLQWALQNVGTSNNVVAAPTPQSLYASRPNTTVDSQATFGAIKGLIIKSAEIVDAYYEEISKKLVGEYVAQSDFGTYIEHTEQSITETSTGVEQVFNNVQKIISDIDGISYYIAEVNAHINSGLLYYDEDGLPVYGLEVGQRNKIDGVEVFNRYARFTSDKLSFYDHNDTEVAYISDRKLYITHVEIKGTFKMGGFVKTVLADGSIVKRWVVPGGEG